MSNSSSNLPSFAEPVVEIYADGKLAYVGFENRAAKRLNMTMSALAFAIDNGMQLPQPVLWTYVGPNNTPWRRPSAKTYIGYWACAAKR